MILCVHICHSIIHPHVKFQRNQANMNIVIGIQSSINHIHWPLFEDEKEERVKIGGVHFHKSRVALKHLALKGTWNKLMSIIQNG